MLGHPKQRELDRPVLTSLDQLVPADHFYRHLEAKLDLSFVREWVADLYAIGGRPAIDPVTFFKLELVLFFEGLRSERQIMRIAADSLSIRWYLGYNFDESLPDHSSLTRIRQRLGLPIFRRFFEHVVELCEQAGLIWGKELFFDATKVQANASLDTLQPRFAVDHHLAQLFGEDGDKHVVQPGNEPSPSDASGEALHPNLPQDGASDLEEQNAGRQDWMAEDGQPDRTVVRGHYHRLSDYQASTTDPDAALMATKTGGKDLGYHDHYVVDGGSARIILSVLVTPADVMENQPMLDLLWSTCFRWQLVPDQVTGDTTYGTVENIVAVEEAGISAYVPLPDFDKRTPYFGKGAFRYDADRDVYICPQDEELERYRVVARERIINYQADPATCNACPLKGQCTASSQGRQVTRSFDEAYLDRVRGYHQGEPYQKAMRKRKVWVEPLFAEAKDWHGLRRFRLRRLWRVNCEALLIAAGQNLKRLLNRRRWAGQPASGMAAPVPVTPQPSPLAHVLLLFRGCRRPTKSPSALDPASMASPPTRWSPFSTGPPVILCGVFGHGRFHGHTSKMARGNVCGKMRFGIAVGQQGLLVSGFHCQDSPQVRLA